jgi:hypothetical protein
MLSYLQTKAVSLALEAKYIRKQEYRFAKKARKARATMRSQSADYFDRNRAGQYHHRMTVVRNEARVTNLARGFLFGHPYSQIEWFAYSQPNWNRVKELVLRYGEKTNPRYNRPLEELFNEWREEGLKHFGEQQSRQAALASSE